jgi:hypothetical protein
VTDSAEATESLAAVISYFVPVPSSTNSARHAISAE